MSSCARWGALLVAALAAVLPPSAGAAEPAKSKAPSDEFSMLAYMQSVSTRMAARTCERGIRDYRKQFDAVYAGWAKKNADAMKRGATLFRRSKNQEWKGIPVTRVEANAIAKAEDELKKPPVDTSPLTFDAATREQCGQLLKDLAAGS